MGASPQPERPDRVDSMARRKRAPAEAAPAPAAMVVLEPGDYWRLHRFLLRRSWRVQQSYLSVFLLPAFMGLAIMALTDAASLPMALGILAVSTGLTLLALWWKKAAIARAFKAAPRPHGHAVMIGPDGIAARCAVHNILYPWAGITGFGQDQHALYVFNRRATTLILPRRAFPTLDDAPRFLAEAVHQWQAHRRTHA